MTLTLGRETCTFDSWSRSDSRGDSWHVGVLPIRLDLRRVRDGVQARREDLDQELDGRLVRGGDGGNL